MLWATLPERRPVEVDHLEYVGTFKRAAKEQRSLHFEIKRELNWNGVTIELKTFRGFDLPIN